MSDARQQLAERRAGSAAGSGLLRKIPVPLRAATYYLSFLGLALVLLPLLAHRLAERWLPWHFELGPARIVGWALLAVSYLLYTISACVLIGRGRGAYVEFDPPQRFVATGPFALCRNPIALGLLGMLLGEALAFSSSGMLLLFVLGVILAHLQVTLVEEPLLKRRFGQQYLDYLERVPRWLPRRPRRRPR